MRCVNAGKSDSEENNKIMQQNEETVPKAEINDMRSARDNWQHKKWFLHKHLSNREWLTGYLIWWNSVSKSRLKTRKYSHVIGGFTVHCFDKQQYFESMTSN